MVRYPYNPLPEPSDPHWEIEAIIRGMRQRLWAGWPVLQAVNSLVGLGADPCTVYLCLEAVKILESDRAKR
jgi:hypothetical protein